MDTLRGGLAALAALIWDAVTGVGALLLGGVRVLAAHWPELVGLFLAGWAGRMGFLWATIAVSDVSPTLAIFILPLAPLSTLLSMVLMMRAMRPTLPAFADVVEPTARSQRWTDDLTVAAQVLIPFLGVYASAGLLKQDVRAFIYDAAADEWMNTNLQSIDWGRATYADGPALIALIVGALAVRKIITLLDLIKRHVAWAALATYVEALWIMTLGAAFSSRLDEVSEWVMTRRAVAGLVAWWEGLVEFLTGWSATLTAFVEFLGKTVANLGNLVVVPVAWLAIGAAVYGHKLKGRELKVETHEEVQARLKRIPQPVRRAVGQVVEPVTTPIESTLKAIGKIASAGVLPMVLFCVVFVLAGRLQNLMAELMRLALGPGDPLRQYALQPYALMVERGVLFVVTLTLLAVAVNRVVLSQAEDAAEDASAEEAAAAESRA